MPRPKLEVADIFLAHGPAYRRANAGHLSLSQLRVMSAIEACRTEALGGHVAACTKCNHQHIAYNSCKNRHCPKCQAPAARDWMAARAEDLLPVEYFHVVFTLPAEIARIALWNKRAVYGLLFKASAETVATIAADPKRLGARVGMTSVLHTWGSALTHHPHIHMIVPGGGLSLDGSRWIACKPGFFLHVRVLSRLFRRLFLEGLAALHTAGQLRFFGDLTDLADANAFAEWLAPLRKIDWVVNAKPPFGGPKAVLVYLSRYTHRVAISNHRLVSADADTVAFRWRDYRIKRGDRMKVMRLPTFEFIRRFLMHVLPDRFHRIRHYGFLAGPVAKRRSPRSAGCLETSNRRSLTNRQRKRHHTSHCASHAPAAVARCASLRFSSADRYPEPEHHPESRPHDEKPIFRVFSSPTLIAPVERTLCLNAIHVPQREPNQCSKADELARSHAKDHDAQLPNSAKPTKLIPISGTGACAFPIALRLHPAASTLSDLSTRATPHDTSLTHWPASKNLRRSGPPLRCVPTGIRALTGRCSRFT